MSQADEPTLTSLPAGATRSASPARAPRAALVSARRGSAPSITRETRDLLRDRLRVAARIIVAALFLFLVRDLTIGASAYLPWLRLVLIAGYAAFGLWLRGVRPVSVDLLRRAEVAMLWTLSLWFAVDRFFYIHQRAAAGDVLEVQFTIDFAVLVYVAFITAYAVFVPNTWQRALQVTLPLALLPGLVVGIALLRHPEHREVLTAALDLPRISSLAFMLLLALAFAVGGARLIHALREQVWEARELGQYRLTEKIGEGGMGEVWRAEHRLLPRPAAIKLVRAELAHTSSTLHADDVLQRFEREVRATANLRSPHTVEIYDFGITDDQVFYYVMELLDGLDLRTLVARHGPLPDERTVHLLIQAAESLAEAHEQGLVHRDVKPANLFACRLGNRYDYVKVLDFGLVAAADPADLETVVPGALAGTPAFMAPEMLVGGLVDSRADLYALGCVGFWLATGSLAHGGESAADQARATLGGPVPAPASRAGRPVDATLEDAIRACLAKEPAQRPASMDELIDRLRSSDLHGRWDDRRARAWWEEHRPPAPA